MNSKQFEGWIIDEILMGSSETWMLDGKGEAMEITNASVAINNIVPVMK